MLNQAVRRHTTRFPADFMFQLTVEEATALRSQIVTLKTGRGQHRKYEPWEAEQEAVYTSGKRAYDPLLAVVR